VRHSFSVSTPLQNILPANGSDSLNATIEHIRRTKKNGQRGRGVEYTLIAVLITFAALQAFFTVGLKAI
jgi:hypothetical protein